MSGCADKTGYLLTQSEHGAGFTAWDAPSISLFFMLKRGKKEKNAKKFKNLIISTRLLYSIIYFSENASRG